jgi:hypothetical protein
MELVIESHFVCMVAGFSWSLCSLVFELRHNPGFHGYDVVLREHLFKVMAEALDYRVRMMWLRHDEVIAS